MTFKKVLVNKVMSTYMQSCGAIFLQEANLARITKLFRPRFKETLVLVKPRF